MSRVASPQISSSGLYGWLLSREEEAARTGYAKDGFKVYRHSPERLDELRAGRPINIRASDLPKWARVGMECHWWDRAVVGPDDTVRFEVDDGHWALQEMGL
jgi:hypothetical protein